MLKKEDQNKLSISEHIEISRWVLDKQLNWITASELKVGVIVTISLALLGSGTALLCSVKQESIDCSVFILFLFMCLFSFISLFFCFKSLIPVTKGPEKSLLFFGKIATYTSDEKYHQDVLLCCKDSFLKDTCSQIYVNAQIVNKKYIWVNNGIWSILFASGFWSILVIVFFI